MKTNLSYIILFFSFAQIWTAASAQPQYQIAQRGQFPWQVGLAHDSGFIYAAGALISEQWFLTPAQSFYENRPRSGHFLAVIGTTKQPYGAQKVPKFDTGTVVQNVSRDRAVIHPGYTRTRSENNIAAVKLNTPIKFTRFLRPVSISCCDPSAGTRVLISGFEKRNLGWMEQYATTKHCEDDKNNIKRGRVCTINRKPIDKTIIVSGLGNPLVVYKGSDSLLVGFMAGSAGDVHIYTSTAYFRDWIRAVTGVKTVSCKSCRKGGKSWWSKWLSNYKGGTTLKI